MHGTSIFSVILGKRVCVTTKSSIIGLHSYDFQLFKEFRKLVKPNTVHFEAPIQDTPKGMLLIIRLYKISK